MNAGANAAAGDLLIFLHADTRLPSGFGPIASQIINQPGVSAGAFRFHLDAASPGFQIIEKVTNWRAEMLRTPYGDQAIFVRAPLFRELGGFPDMPIMEDFAFLQLVKKKGRIRIAPLAATTSARRWQTQGVCKTTLIHWLIVWAYWMGISPARIYHWAQHIRDKTEGARQPKKENKE
jgi:hypothetical protein